MKALTFQLTLEQPVLVARPSAGEENSQESHNFIPGSALRGALIGNFLSLHPGLDVSRDPQCRSWFFSGEHCYLNAYPTVAKDRQRMLPRPLSWRVAKAEKNAESADVFDFAIRENLLLDSPVIPGSEYVIFQDETDAVMANSVRESVPHNASLIRQVKKSDDSFVFQYDVLAAGQTFSGAIVGNQVDQLLETMSIKEDLVLFLGGSRSAKYGRVRLHSLVLMDDWKEYVPQGIAPAEKVIITLLSDAIFLSKTGQPAVTPVAYLGSEPVACFYKTRLVGGFNRKWGLPLPQVAAVMAGSVFVYRSDQINSEVLTGLRDIGMGERCVDGFGRIAINWNGAAQIRRIPQEQPTSSAPTQPILRPVSKEIARFMAEQRFRSLLNDRLLTLVSVISIENPPNKAQLSQFRQSAKASMAHGQLAPMIKRLQELKRTAKRQFERSRVTHGTLHQLELLDWLNAGLSEDFSNDRSFWKWLKPSEVPKVAGEEIQHLELIQVEYIARFIDALMQRTIRLSQKNASEEGEE